MRKLFVMVERSPGPCVLASGGDPWTFWGSSVGTGSCHLVSREEPVSVHCHLHEDVNWKWRQSSALREETALKMTNIMRPAGANRELTAGQVELGHWNGRWAWRLMTSHRPKTRSYPVTLMVLLGQDLSWVLPASGFKMFESHGKQEPWLQVGITLP